MTTTAPACTACGTAVAPGAPFCGTCGATVTTRTAVATTTAPASAPAHPRVEAAPDPAPPGRRLLAYLIDGAVITLIVILTYLIFGGMLGAAVSGGSSSAAVVGLIGLTLAPTLAMVVYAVFLVVWEGRAGLTVGNRLVGIRTVTFGTTDPPGMGKAFLRRLIEGLGAVVIIGSAVIAYSAAWDGTRRRQGWHDKVVGTEMVSADGSTRPSPAVARPAAAPRAAQQPAAVEATSPALPPPPPWPALPPVPPVVATSPAVAAASPPPVAARPTGGLIDAVPGMVSEHVDQVTAPPAPPRAAPMEDDLELTMIRRPRALHNGTYRLAFDTGEALVVTGSGLVGRNPTPRTGETYDHLIPIADPALSVSKTHLAFGVGPDGFWVLDRGSTNGTWTVTAEGARAQVASGSQVTVPVGSTVEFGDRRFTVSAP